MLSAYGVVARVQMIKLEKEYTSFILIHFKDTNSVANVMRNKDHIIVADCKFNVSEPKVSPSSDKLILSQESSHSILESMINNHF